MHILQLLLLGLVAAQQCSPNNPCPTGLQCDYKDGATQQGVCFDPAGNATCTQTTHCLRSGQICLDGTCQTTQTVFSSFLTTRNIVILSVSAVVFVLLLVGVCYCCRCCCFKGRRKSLKESLGGRNGLAGRNSRVGRPANSSALGPAPLPPNYQKPADVSQVQTMVELQPVQPVQPHEQQYANYKTESLVIDNPQKYSQLPLPVDNSYSQPVDEYGYDPNALYFNDSNYQSYYDPNMQYEQGMGYGYQEADQSYQNYYQNDGQQYGIFDENYVNYDPAYANYPQDQQDQQDPRNAYNAGPMEGATMQAPPQAPPQGPPVPVMNERSKPVFARSSRPPKEQGFFAFWDKYGRFHQGYTDAEGVIVGGVFDDLGQFHFGQIGQHPPVTVEWHMMAEAKRYRNKQMLEELSRSASILSRDMSVSSGFPTGRKLSAPSLAHRYSSDPQRLYPDNVLSEGASMDVFAASRFEGDR